METAATASACEAGAVQATWQKTRAVPLKCGVLGACDEGPEMPGSDFA